MDFEPMHMKFFVLHVKAGAPYETRYSELKPIVEGRAPTCPICGEYVGMIPTLPPYGAEITAFDKQPGDIAFGPANNLLVSEKFRQSWDGKRLRGLDFHPIERLRVRPARLGKKPLTYFHVAPRYFGTHIDLERSTFEHEDPISCSQCHYGGLLKSIRGMQIDEVSWTGEDMFFAWGLCGTVIVTDRVRQLRDEFGLTNINLTPVESFFWDPYNQWSVIDYSRDEVPAPDEDDQQNTSMTN